MRRFAQSLIGLALIAVGVYAFVALDHRSEWVALIFVGVGGFLVSKTATSEVIKTGVATAKELLPWK